MRPAFAICVFLFHQMSSIAQSVKADYNSCSRVLDDLSFFWKRDSLGNNGARYYSYQKLLHCTFSDSLSVDEVLDKLGKPNHIQKSNQGISFNYNYLDNKKMPKGYRGPYACFYISFMFSLDRKRLLSVTDEDWEY